MEVTRYATEVTAVGALVPDFVEQQILVFFSDAAPEELHDFSVLHHPTVAKSGLTTGDEVVIDGTTMRVLSVGDLAEQNLLALGHLNLKANGASQAPLPGDVCVEARALPIPRPGSKLWITGTLTPP
ncbi:PTS glucitol/sorbitol transporter subunit IIA [Phytohabitans rumicis]|nr:PTS glucitol/sorbitol transporter subunit IIA [Phytohabitans rumicis]